jgi:hypothetical protein
MKIKSKDLDKIIERYLFEKDEEGEPTFEKKLEDKMKESNSPFEAYNNYRIMSEENPNEEVTFPEQVKKYLKDTLSYTAASKIKKISLTNFIKDHGAAITTLTNAAKIKDQQP